jgi:predicted RNase H-like nuclease (RuvC/YqgF family)
MGTWCTEGVKRTRRDNERVETINDQNDELKYCYNKMQRLQTENKKLKKQIEKLSKRK